MAPCKNQRSHKVIIIIFSLLVRGILPQHYMVLHAPNKPGKPCCEKVHHARCRMPGPYPPEVLAVVLHAPNKPGKPCCEKVHHARCRMFLFYFRPGGMRK